MMNYFSSIVILLELTIVVSQSYNRSVLMEKYPDLGKNFIMFPNEESGIKIGYLDDPGPNRLFGFGSIIEDDVTFTLYTRKKPRGLELKTYSDIPKDFDRSKKTVFVTHGWMSSGKQDACISIKNSYLNKSDVNVFVMDWSPIAGNIFYFIPMSRTREVGKYYSNLLNFLSNDLGMDPKEFHLIGHSLGAHVSGFAGRGLRKGKVGRITGLDPALPGFDVGLMEGGRLNTNDSYFVDIIHTCAGFLGLKQPIGHADFYPNGGVPPQPGCTLLETLEACSHGRSWKLFAESITLEQTRMANKCATFELLFNGKCNGDEVPIGLPTPSDATGVYYAETAGEQPYLMFP